MSRKPFSTTFDANTLRALKVLAVKQDRPLNKVLEEAAERYVAEKAAEDPDVRVFAARAKEPLEDSLGAIERRIAQIRRRRA